MTILALLAVLAGSNWSTTCVMTQADGLQGYTIDSAAFKKASTEAKDTLDVTFTRTWFKDEKCAQSMGTTNVQTGTVMISNSLETIAFPGPASEDLFAADWTMNGARTQLGAIAISTDRKSIRTATTSFGGARNTMLSLFKYFAN